MHYHRNMKATATLALAHVGDTHRYGAVGMNESGRIVSFIEKREGNIEGLINGGVYVLTREVLDFIPGGQPVSLEPDILTTLIGGDLYGRPLKGYLVYSGVAPTAWRLRPPPTQLLAPV